MSPARVPLLLSRATLVTAIIFTLASCVSSPDDAAELQAGAPLEQRSVHGLAMATVVLDAPSLVRGPNDFRVTLHAAGGAEPSLTSAEASMAAHGHHTVTSDIVRTSSGYLVSGLDLFMSGRWQVTLGVLEDNATDVVVFALDVP